MYKNFLFDDIDYIRNISLDLGDTSIGNNKYVNEVIPDFPKRNRNMNKKNNIFQQIITINNTKNESNENVSFNFGDNIKKLYKNHLRNYSVENQKIQNMRNLFLNDLSSKYKK